MKQLTQQEVAFVKETGFTPTVFQCDEYYRTIFTKERCECNRFSKAHDEYSEEWYEVASEYAKEKYGFDLNEFLIKNIGASLNDTDSISLEYVATYLLYCFFTKEELENLSEEDALKWLLNYRYFFGFRKWEANGMQTYINEAIECHDGTRMFYLEEDGNVWNTSTDNIKDNSYFDDKTILVRPILEK